MKVECGNCGAVESDNRMYFVSCGTIDDKTLGQKEFDNLNEVGIEPIDYGYYGRFFPVPFSIYVLGVKR